MVVMNIIIIIIITLVLMNFWTNTFLLIEDIWHDVQKGSGFILSSISWQIFALSPDINDLVYLCPNLWCNNSKAAFFLGAIFLDLGICFIFTKNVCFLFVLCGKVTAFFSLSSK